MKTFWYLCETKPVEIKGEEVLERMSGWSNKRRVVKTNDGDFYKGKYYADYDDALAALIKKLEKRKASQKLALQKAKAELDNTIRLISFWKEQLQQQGENNGHS